MPRKNNRKVQPQFHGASIYDSGFKSECYGCAFAGNGFKCLTSDGNCLKGSVTLHPMPRMARNVDSDADR